VATYLQAGRFGPATISGAPIGTSVRILDSAGNDAALYSDASKNKTAGPIVQSDSSGLFSFYADPGTYTARWSGGSATVTVAGGAEDTSVAGVALYGIRRPPTWGQYWYPKLAAAKAGTGTAVVAFVGSSTTQGYYASNPRKTGYVARLKTALQSYAGGGGSGFEGMQWSNLFLSGAPENVFNSWVSAGVPWSFTGSWSTPTFWRGPALGTIDGTAGSTQTISFSGTSVDLWFYNKWNPTVESFTYSIDGGAFTGTVTSSAGYGPDFSAQFQTVSGLPDGPHTVTMTAGANGCRLVGVRARTATGVTVDNFGIAGMQSRGWSNKDNQNSGTYMGGWRVPADLVVIQLALNDIIKAVQTYSSAGTTNNSPTVTHNLFREADIGRVVSGTGIPLGAKIVSVSAGTSATLDQNAAATGTVNITITDPDPVSRWVSNTQTYLDGVLDDVYAGNSKSGAVDIIFTVPIIRPSSDNAKIKLEMAAAVRGMADYYGAAVVDTGLPYRQSWIYAQQQGVMGSSASAGTAGNDEVHPSDAGHEATANQLLKIMIPR
jgi:hypothetical protein